MYSQLIITIKNKPWQGDQDANTKCIIVCIILKGCILTAYDHMAVQYLTYYMLFIYF